MKKKAPKVEYKTLDEVFEIIKGEMTGGKYKPLVAPMNDQNDHKLVVDNDYMVELQEKYSLALDMWSKWYEEYTKELKNVKELEKKLDIAVKTLEELETKSDKFDNSWSMQEQLDFIKAKCQETLYQLKEIEDIK